MTINLTNHGKLKMGNKNSTAINPTREQDYPSWYQEVIKAADLAEHSTVRGCMVIKPWGYAIWERIQQYLDTKIKETGHKNFYFPMFIPLSMITQEANHIEGFAKECAVVTHHRLEGDAEGNLKPAGKLEEPLIIRPTSEVVIGEAFSRWIKSYRDLPLLCNQWSSVVRWEMRTRLFLRTSEFLWQEGHTAHATPVEAKEEAEKMLEVYRELAENFLATPVYIGFKTGNEKFPGADITYCIEMMMQDKKALQEGTSHFLGQNFSKAFNIKFSSQTGNEEFVWTTSWGVSTRLIGGLIMSHSDDNGLVLPPTIAPTQIIIIPLVHKKENHAEIMDYCIDLSEKLNSISYQNEKIRVEVDCSEKSAGEKIWGWIKKGVPIRIEVGKRELESNKLSICRRDKEPKDKEIIDSTNFIANAPKLLAEVQKSIFHKAKEFQETNTHTAHSKEDFYKLFETNSGFVKTYWAGDNETEEKLKKDLKVTARCIPSKHDTGQCIFTGLENSPLTIFARSY